MTEVKKSFHPVTSSFRERRSVPPELPPILRRKTSSDIEQQLEGNLSSHYENLLANDNEPFSSQVGLKDTHYYFLNPPEDREREPLHMKAIMKELSKTLPHQLDINARGSMFMRFDEANPQYLRAVLTGMEGTPYSSGIFIFDIFLPADYPDVPCYCRHVTPNANLVHANNGPGGFSPNLHSDTGQVCLSLLGTWDGPGWESGTSNVYQVLSTILYMILGAKHPYYMEPDYGGWEGTAPQNIDDDPERYSVIEYDEEVKLFNAKLCILAPLQQPPKGFEALVHTHLFEKRKLILATLQRWAAKGSEKLRHELGPVISQIKQAYEDHITLRYAEDDVVECKHIVAFIEEKMTFLATKIECCEKDHNHKSTQPLTSTTEVAAKILPKAWERYKMGPILLDIARRQLAWAESIVHRLQISQTT